MIRIIQCISTQHDWRFLFLAVLVCLFGCYTTMIVLARARDPAGTRHKTWLFAAAVVAGGSVWTTHFMSMLAFQPGVAVEYDIELTLLSILVAVVLAWVGFSLALRAGAGAVVSGGAVVGLSIAAMHYLGMAALSMPARLHWSGTYIAASMVVGTVFAAAALAVHSRSAGFRYRFAATLLLTMAIAGMHFTGMTALTVEPDPRIAVSPMAVDPQWLAAAIAGMMVAIAALGLFGSAVDRHLAELATREGNRLKAHIAELEMTKAQLEATTVNLEVALDAAAASARAKSKFLAMVSHELRTPLNAVIGFSEMLTGEIFGPLGDERYKEYIDDIRTSGLDLLEVINDVLDLSNLDAGSLALLEDTVDLAALIRRALRLVRRQADEGGLHLSENLGPDLPLVRGDERRLLQILVNLLSNAVAFTPSGGSIQVAAFRHENGLVITVTDSGIGIAPQNIPKLLDRFEQLDNSLSRKHEGLGLGLPLSKRLIELHGGMLSVESTLGAGTVVTLTVPGERLIGDRRAA